MKQIQFLNKKYSIPESWNDVTLKMQMEVSTVASQQAYVKTLGILAGYTGIPVEELKTAKINDLQRVMKSMSFLNDPIPEEPVFKFSYNGHEYTVQDNILEQQFQDYVAIQTAIAEYSENKWMTTPYILAVMCKRENETLDDFDINARAKEFEDVPIAIANGIAAFFFEQFEGIKIHYDVLFTKSSRRYSAKQSQRIKGFSKQVAKAAWWEFTYSLVDYDITKVHQIFRMPVGEVLQFASIKQLKEEMEADLHDIAMEEAKRKG